MPDIPTLDRRALAVTVKIVNQSGKDQLDLPIPCEDELVAILRRPPSWPGS
jgi:hypothetical protein